MINRLGIRHGRILGRKHKETDFFASNKWKDEFILAKKYNYDLMELSIPAGIDNHPILTKKKRREIYKVANDNDIIISCICYDYLIVNPINHLFKLHCNKWDINNLLDYTMELNIKKVLIPFLGHATIKNNINEFKKIVDYLNLEIDKRGLSFQVETDLNAQYYLENIAKDYKNLKLTYDTGNANYFNMDIYKDINLLKKHIIDFHIKDSNKSIPNIKLGEGTVNFKKIFKLLNKISFMGDFILETPYPKYKKEPELNNMYIRAAEQE
ncbi:sugar phosphate isomerase/epimerase [bacterium]|nr:sugar phosphate isomerase/epimerase [bacterium]